MPRTRWTEEQIRELLREHEASGLSLRAFALAVDVPPATFSAWRRRLRGATAPRLVPVHVPPATDAQELRVEIAVDGIVLRVSGNDERIARLIRAIARC